MPKFTIQYDVRYYNGQTVIEAIDEDEARRKFDEIPLDKLIEETCSSAADIEDVFEGEE